jgi:hypothetical protein
VLIVPTHSQLLNLHGWGVLFLISTMHCSPLLITGMLNTPS